MARASTFVLLFVLLGALSLGWVRSARAEAAQRGPRLETVLLHLEVSEAEQPGYLCLLTRAGRGPLVSDVPRFEAKTGHTWYVGQAPEASNVQAVAFSGQEANASALALLSQQRLPRPSLARPAECAPGIEAFNTEAPLRIDCAPNRRGTGGRPHVAVLHVDVPLEAVSPGVNRLVLDGSLAVLELSGFTLPMGQLQARSVGGHFAPGASPETTVKVGDQHHVSLSLAPRCAAQELELPLPLTGRLCVEIVEPEARTGNASTLMLRAHAQAGRAEIPLPHSRRDAAQMVSAFPEARADELCESQGSRPLLLRGLLRPGAADSALRMEVARFGFAWKRHCMHAGRCPEARVEGLGRCENRGLRDDQCTYACGSETPGASTTLPKRVVFTSESLEQWEDVLTQPDETLDAYTDPSRWKVALSLREQAREVLHRDWDRITSIELEAAGGAPVSVHSPNGDERVRLPAAECGSRVQYRVVGDRAYGAGQTTVEQGQLRIDVKSHDRELRLWPALGAGATVTKTHNSPLVEAQANLRYHPTDFRFAFEAEGGVQLSLREFGTIGLAGREYDRVPYVRLPAGLRASYLFSSAFQLGLGLGVQAGHPLDQDDELRAGAWDFSSFGSAMARFRLLGDGWLFAEGRVVFGEQFRRHISDREGTPATLLEDELSLAFIAGTVFGL